MLLAPETLAITIATLIHLQCNHHVLLCWVCNINAMVEVNQIPFSEAWYPVVRDVLCTNSMFLFVLNTLQSELLNMYRVVAQKRPSRPTEKW